MMNNIDLSVLSDRELNSLIGQLLEISVSDRTDETEGLGFSASTEWRRRYPGTIAPVIFERAQRSGGFPSCYAGPRNTVELEE